VQLHDSGESRCFLLTFCYSIENPAQKVFCMLLEFLFDQGSKTRYYCQIMTTEKEYLSREKHEELKQELEFLTHIRRKEIAEALEAAKSLGDLSENAEYHAAREAQAGVEERISVVEEILKNAVIVTSKHKTDTVGVGSVVTVKKGKEQKTYTVVGSEEADITAGKISNKSPLGLAMLHKKKGDQFNYTTPAGIVECTIVDIQ